MIIYGTRTSESTIGQGGFDCPRCRTPQGFRHVVMKRWFTLYFIPVIPLGQVGEQVECLGCCSRFAPEVAIGLPGTETLSAIVLDEGEPLPRGALPRASPLPSSAPFASTSLLLGLLSPFLLCACGLSILSSLGAIVTGHLALVRINRSGGKLAGRGMALSGLALGYVLLLVSVLFWVRLGPMLYGSLQNADNRADDPKALADKTPEERLLDAELRVLSPGTDGVATGNTREAKEIAEAYSALLKTTRDELFTKDRERMLTLTTGQFIVHCELHADRCALIVHVPAYRDFTNDAKEVLEMSAWVLAQEAVEGKIPPGSKLAVGLRGTIRYGAVMEGRVAAGDEVDDFMRRDRDDLVAYFPATVVEAARDGDATLEPAGNDSAPQPADVAAAETPAPSEPPLVASISPMESLPPDPPSPTPEPVPAEPKPAEPVEPMPSAPRRKARPPRPAPAVPQAAPLPAVGEVVATFPDLGWSVQSLAFAPGGRFLAAGKIDSSVHVFDVEKGSHVQAATDLRDLGQVTGLAFSFDGSRLFAAGYSGVIRSWQVGADGRLKAAEPLHGHAKSVTCLVASPAAKFVASGSAAGELVWQSYANSAQPPRSLTALERGVLAIHLPPDRLEGLATDGRRLIEFDLREGKVIRSLELGRSSAQVAAFSSDGAQLALLQGHEIRLCDAKTGDSLATVPAAAQMQWAAAFLPSGKGLVSGGQGEATLWRLPDGEPAARVDLGGALYIQTLALSADSKLLAAIPAAAGQTLTVVRLPESP